MDMRVRIYLFDGEPFETVFDGSKIRLNQMDLLCMVYDATHIEILGVGPDA